MLREQKILAAALSGRKHWSVISRWLDKKSLSGNGKALLKLITEYYKADATATTVDKDLVYDRLLQLFPKDQRELLEFTSGITENPSDFNVVQEIVDQHKSDLAQQIAVAVGTNAIDKIDGLVAQYADTTVIDEADRPQVYTAPDIAEVAEAFKAENLVPVYPTKLNNTLGGGVPRQSQIGVFARPDVGKSTVAMNMAIPMCERGYKVIYFGNEDPDQTMILRAYTRFLRTNSSNVLDNLGESYQKALEKGLENFTFIRLQPGSIAEILTFVEDIRPDVIIIDQLRNMTTTNAKGSMTDNINTLAAATRSIAKQYDLVSVVITQAGDSAHNKLILEYTDVEYSNTGFAAQLDLLIGAGQNQDLKDMNRIMLAFPKNKLCGPITPFEATIDYPTNRVMA